MKYRVKQEIVEAYKVGSGQPPEWINEAIKNNMARWIPRGKYHEELPALWITTEHGVATVEPWDFVIKDSRGFLSMCTAKNFDSVYEPVESGAPA